MRRRGTRLLAGALAALFVTSLAAVPAQATYGPPLTIDFQLQAQGSTGTITQVGRLVGSLRFDDGNAHYRLDVIICRQSSFVTPTARTSVNGSPHQVFSGEDGTRRPEVCGTHGLSSAVNAEFAFGGIIQNITVTFEGLFFDGATSTARPIVRSRTYDNPFN